MVTNCQEWVTKLALTLPKCSLSVVTHLLSLQTHCQHGISYFVRETKQHIFYILTMHRLVEVKEKRVSKYNRRSFIYIDVSTTIKTAKLEKYQCLVLNCMIGDGDILL